MKNDFEDYYKKVREDASDMVDSIYDDLLEELGENSSYSFETWTRLNEPFLSEYNNGIYIHLREAVEILEQSTRQLQDEGLYQNAGSPTEQVRAMGYWTYRNDLMAEFSLALKSRLQNDLGDMEEEASKLQNEFEDMEEQIETIEDILSDLEVELIEEGNADIEERLKQSQRELEELKKSLDEIEERVEFAVNKFENAQNFIGEIL